MNDSLAKPLRWSKQLNILPTSAIPNLKGDRIILPQQALEELLTAATTTVQNTDRPQTSNFDPYNPYSYAAETVARQQLVERQQNLPHPLTFRLVNPQNGRVIFAGIREFSAPDGTVGLSSFLKESLDIKGGDKPGEAPTKDGEHVQDVDGVEGLFAKLTVHVQELSKGTFVKLRPLEAGYDVDDWKALLEQYLRNTFTTLTNGEVISVPAGKEVFKFLVDELRPSNEGVSLVDTDIEVDIEPLNEEQARETLQKLARKTQRAAGTQDGNSAGGTIRVDSSETGQVIAGDYVDYSIKDWDHSADLEIDATSLVDDREIDIFVSPFAARHRTRPRDDSFVFGDISSRSRKRIRIEPTNVELEGATALYISVRGYGLSQETQDSNPTPIPYTLQVSNKQLDPDASNLNDVAKRSAPGPEEEICSNCQQIVPKRTMFLHQNFCLRNNILCRKCGNVFQKSSPEWKNHWHCEHDTDYGNSIGSKQKHDKFEHSPMQCPLCDFIASNTRVLAHHRTTTCPSKPILCQFCHLHVPQQGPDDPPADSAEVVLSGLTPHEVSDGARTTECHLCNRLVRLRNMSAHLRHHDLQRIGRMKPHLCRNVNCGRILATISKTGDVRPQAAKNELGVCDTCFGPLYVSMYDPDGRALRRRVERKYLTQLLTGCGQSWCVNEYCTTGRQHLGVAAPGQGTTSKEAMQMIKPTLDGLMNFSNPLNFCTNETSQNRRTLAAMMTAEGAVTEVRKGKAREDTVAVAENSSGYGIEWCVAALDAESGDLDKARGWLKGFAPTIAESKAV